MQLSLKQKLFFILLSPFRKLDQYIKFFEKKDDRPSYFILDITDCEKPG